MIFFLYQSKLFVATLVFYTRIYYPILQAKRSLTSFLASIFLSSVVHNHHNHDPSYSSSVCLGGDGCCWLREEGSRSIRRVLTEEVFGDLKKTSKCNSDSDDAVADQEEHEESCSVCLVEFESGDLVTKLRRCGHVFHMGCIGRWMERNQFTCPLCRSVFWNVVGGERDGGCISDSSLVFN